MRVDGKNKNRLTARRPSGPEAPDVKAMAIHFQLGPAGSGKTHRCLADIRDALQASPDGPPLLLIAPRQSTYLLERQLLGMGVPGFTRLEILSFDRLARRVLEELGRPVRDLLSEEGRVMVLRALLTQLGDKLGAFREAARTGGFAAQLSQILRELQRGGSSPDRIRRLKLPGDSPALLTEKLHDLALLLEAYRGWLKEHQLHDPDDLLALAAEELAVAHKTSRPAPHFGGLWLDGFAEMTPPEIHLLAGLLPGCDAATLAFCLNRGPDDRLPAGQNALWSVTNDTVQRLQTRIKELGLPFALNHLPEHGAPLPRFRTAPALRELAASWNAGTGLAAGQADGINLVECADPEAEALLAVRLINGHVRHGGGRYHDISVIVRRMEDYADVLQLTFRRHGIPFFADHREPMGHHPVAELTRSVLSMTAHGWLHEDWINALKTGLVADNARLVDSVENAALARGVRGPEWLDIAAYQNQIGLTEGAAKDLSRPVEAFLNFKESLSAAPTGPELAQALQSFWAALRVPEMLEKWQAETDGMRIPPIYRTIHRTAWEQMDLWCSNLALAFDRTPLSARDWLAVAEAGLSSLTLGVVPPALDQVFIGAVDRARQPAVKLTIVLGLNGGVFPAAPPAPALLNRAERIALQSEKNLGLTWEPVQLAARENYYAYIACTRPSERLCVSWSRRGRDGKMLIRSAVAERLLEFAGLKLNEEATAGDVSQFDGKLKAFNGNFGPENAASFPELLECPGWDRFLPGDAGQRSIGIGGKDCRELREQLLPAGGEENRRLGGAALEKLHPEKLLYSSVSALETFANCPFHHFAEKQLRLGERDEFKADQKSIGTLLHAVIKRFHEFTFNEKKQPWRDWEPAAAAKKIRELGGELMREEPFAPQSQDELVRWESLRKIEGLALAIGQMVAWFKTCAFDPVLSEFKFSDRSDAEGNAPGAPAWSVALENGRTLKLQGSIDRLDICRLEDGRLLVAVFDYKTGGKSPNRAQLQKGFELQLLGYLAFAAESAELKEKLAGGKELVPAGAFYVPLSPKINSMDVNATDSDRKTEFLKSLTHHGRADRQWLDAAFDKSARKDGRTWIHSLQFKPHEQSATFMKSEGFTGLLETTREFLVRHATDILAGNVGVLPARFGAQSVSCNWCPFQPVCRFEPVFGDFRPGKYDKPAAPAEKSAASDDAKKSPKPRKAGKKSS
jgi:ATP-dependent helicase/nuclease subunit B